MSLRIYFTLILALFIFPNHCHALGENSELFFHGIPNKEVLLYKIKKNSHGSKSYLPIRKITTNSKIQLKQGSYLILNECSSYEFQHQSEKDTHIYLSRIHLTFLGKSEINLKFNSNQYVKTSCYESIGKLKKEHINKFDFDILPGKNTLYISGHEFDLYFNPLKYTDTQYDLTPVSLKSAATLYETSSFFVMDEQKNSVGVVSAPINSLLWMYPGKYQIEINGTKKKLELIKGVPVNIELGAIRVTAPKNFPLQKRLEKGGQFISIFMNNFVLLRLDVTYPIFSGNYTLHLDGSDLEKNVSVEESTLEEVKTYGAEIDAPACEKTDNSCASIPNITIHSNKQPFVLMTVQTGLPFLVFDDSYQYGVEGIKGIYKKLSTSKDSVFFENLGHVKIRWENKLSRNNIKTDLVRFESASSYISGKSVDLNFFKPHDVFLPEGNYIFSYLTVDSNSNYSSKSRVDLTLDRGETKEVSVPLYLQTQNNGTDDLRKQEKWNIKPENNSILTPIGR